jgi:hypothetical protein
MSLKNNNMKTKISIRFTLAVILASFIFTSCTKELAKSSSTPIEFAPINPTVGSILDLGAVHGSIRKFNIQLNNVTSSVNGLTETEQSYSTQVNFILFSGLDGIIPEGTYMYLPNESPETPSPFQVELGSVLLKQNVSDEFNTSSFSSLTVTVTRTGMVYSITVDGTLSDGNVFQGSVNGLLDYADSES